SSRPTLPGNRPPILPKSKLAATCALARLLQSVRMGWRRGDDARLELEGPRDASARLSDSRVGRWVCPPGAIPRAPAWLRLPGCPPGRRGLRAEGLARGSPGTAGVGTADGIGSRRLGGARHAAFDGPASEAGRPARVGGGRRTGWTWSARGG